MELTFFILEHKTIFAKTKTINMNNSKSHRFFKFSFILTLIFGMILSLSEIQAQGNLKPNISPIEKASDNSEFTEKGVNIWTEESVVSNYVFNDINSKRFKLYDLLDKPLVIELWELKNTSAPKNKKYLKRFYNQYNINILSICSEDYPNEIRKLSREQDLKWSAVYDDFRRFNGKSFTDTHGLKGAGFVIITPDKKIKMIVDNTASIGRVGVYLQKYFASEN